MNIVKIDPKQAKHLIDELDRYQESLYPSESNHLDALEILCKKNVIMLGAMDGDSIAAIGAVKIYKNYGEIKRLYVPQNYRGHGHAKKIMVALEDKLIKQSILTSNLETGIKQPEAIGFYKNFGYKECGPFGSYKEDPLSVFMSKRLSA